MLIASKTRGAGATSLGVVLFCNWKRATRAIATFTVYDAVMARLVAGVGPDALIVGDSLGPNALGIALEDVSLEDMIHHGRAVRRGAPHAPVVLDIPPSAMRCTPAGVARRCRRALKTTGADAVKIEGGTAHVVEAIEACVQLGVCVFAHLVHSAAVSTGESEIVRQAIRVQAAGADVLVLQSVPSSLAASVTSRLEIATLGVESSDGCNGAIANVAALLGLLDANVHAMHTGAVNPRWSAPASLLKSYCERMQQPRSAQPRPESERVSFQ